MRISIAVLILASFAAFTDQSKADVITTYNVTGSFEDGASLSGTVTIDTTTADATSMNLSIASPYLGTLAFNSTSPTYFFNSVDLPTSPDSIKTLLELEPYPYDFAQLSVYAPNYVWPSGSIPLIDLNTMQSGNESAYGIFSPEYGNLYLARLVSGELNPVSTPEPASITLMASSCLAFGGFGLYRRRRGRSIGSRPI
jgi:hypothetical protein